MPRTNNLKAHILHFVNVKNGVNIENVGSIFKTELLQNSQA